MYIDKATMMISGFAQEELDQIINDTEVFVLRGTCSPELNELFFKWVRACGFDERTSQLLKATAFPQRLLLSILRHMHGIAGTVDIR